jgi:hypothetical protein
MGQVRYVKNWDNGGRSRTGGEGLPKLAFWDAWFSKTGQELKSKSVKRLEEISTFQATTVTAISISSLLSCFLEAVSTIDGKNGRLQGVAQK